MIIHAAPNYQIYFGDAKDRMYPNDYATWNDFSLCSREPIAPLVRRLHLNSIFFLRQVHGMQGAIVTDSLVQEIPPFSVDGDFLITNEPHTGIGIVTADCLPVIVYDRKRYAIGIAHAGWRGAVAGVVPALLSKLKQAYGSEPSDLMVFFGPSAKRCCYEVDSSFLTNLEAYPFADTVVYQHADRLFFDLPFFVEQQLFACGIVPHSLCKEYNACTICDTRFHSYRRATVAETAESTGRQMTVVALK